MRANSAYQVVAWSKEEMVQRGHHFAVVDEVDSILIDEARTPLIISGPADQATTWYAEFARIANTLKRDVDYEVDEKKKTIGILEEAIDKVEDQIGIDNLYDTVNTPLVGFMNNAIRAKELFKRDRDYVVMNGEVIIVDEHTGRILAGRRYNEGLHQSIEAKEGVEVKAENQTLATVTLQNFFRLYSKLSGMTGTAMTEAAEFNQIYNLGVVPIPTNRDMVRIDNSDLVYRTEDAKYNAVLEDIVERHAHGQPILVGTTSVEKSETLSRLLKQNGVPHEVLNAKHHEREAAIVAQAGRRGAVVVATNMAGRGTDIILGGNPEFMAAAALEQRGMSPVEDPEAYEIAWHEEIERQKGAVRAEHEEVTGLGGLYVLATERHESRRIDNQLRGRSGRQGDPGETQFYLSLEDDLMRLFKSDMVDAFLRRFNVPDDVPIEAKMVTNAIRSAQSQVEAQNFEIRKDVLKYDDVLNRQRLVIYDERRRVIEGEDIEEQVRTFISDTVTGYVQAATSEGYPESWDLEQLWTALKQLYPVQVSVEELEERSGGSRAGLSSDFLVTELVDDAQGAYDHREETLGDEVTRELERRVILSVLDRKWREHLYEMDYLRDGIGLRAMAQRDPLIEYQREGFELFTAMMDSIKEETVGYLFNVEVQVNPPVSEEAAAAVDELVDATGSDATAGLAAAVAAGSQSARKPEPEIVAKGLGPSRPQKMEYSAPSESGGVMHGQMEVEDGGIVEIDPNASRAERRRLERENRKKR
jgi:preprotein translocase subunit SecA